MKLFIALTALVLLGVLVGWIFEQIRLKKRFIEGSSTAETLRNGSRISAQVADTLIKTEHAVLLDIREEDEIASGMAETAIWIPTTRIQNEDPLFTKWLQSLSKNQLVLVYCAAGGRADRVVTRLVEEGYQAYNVGGFKDWKAAGLPVKVPASGKGVDGLAHFTHAPSPH